LASSTSVGSASLYITKDEDQPVESTGRHAAALEGGRAGECMRPSFPSLPSFRGPGAEVPPRFWTQRASHRRLPARRQSHRSTILTHTRLSTPCAPPVLLLGRSRRWSHPGRHPRTAAPHRRTCGTSARAGAGHQPDASQRCSLADEPSNSRRVHGRIFAACAIIRPRTGQVRAEQRGVADPLAGIDAGLGGRGGRHLVVRL